MKGYSCGGSGTSFPGQFTDFSNFGHHDRESPPATCGITSAALDQYNFAPTNYFQRPDTRYLFNAFMHYDVLPQVRAYAEFDYMNDRTNSQIAPSGSFFQRFTLQQRQPARCPRASRMRWV